MPIIPQQVELVRYVESASPAGKLMASSLYPLLPVYGYVKTRSYPEGNLHPVLQTS
jgi:hypothetical protein